MSSFLALVCVSPVIGTLGPSPRMLFFYYSTLSIYISVGTSINRLALLSNRFTDTVLLKELYSLRALFVNKLQVT